MSGKVKYQVFISSTYKDLTQERWAAMQALLSMDCIVSGMELFPAIDLEQFEYIKQIIDDCDYYLLILGGKYGTVNAETGQSYTEMEYDYAVSKGLKVIALVHEKPETLPPDYRETSPEELAKFQTFRDKASKGRLVRFWTDISQIDSLVTKGMFHAMREFSAVGWIRADRIASEELLTENNRLRKENDALKEKLRDTPGEISEYDVLCKEPPFLLKGVLSEQYFEKTVSWKDVFSIISSLLRDWKTEGELSSELFSFLWETDIDRKKNDILKGSLEQESMLLIIYTLTSLNIIYETEAGYSFSEARTVRSYKLSMKGRGVALKLSSQL